VIDRHKRAVGPPYGPAGEREALERLRRGHLVNQVPVDVQESGAVQRALDDVVVPDLVVHGAWAGRFGIDALSHARQAAPGEPGQKAASGEPGRLSAES